MTARYFAILDSNAAVIQVIVADQAFIDAHAKPGFAYVETDMDGIKSKNYARLGDKHDAAKNAFIPPKPFPSWTLDEQKFVWAPPTPRLEDAGGKIEHEQEWDETSKTWKKVQKEKDTVK